MGRRHGVVLVDFFWRLQWKKNKGTSRELEKHSEILSIFCGVIIQLIHASEFIYF